MYIDISLLDPIHRGFQHLGQGPVVLPYLRFLVLFVLIAMMKQRLETGNLPDHFIELSHERRADRVNPKIVRDTTSSTVPCQGVFP